MSAWKHHGRCCGRIDGWWGVIARRLVMQRESTGALVLNPSGETSGARACTGDLCLDKAFVLIEGHPPSVPWALSVQILVSPLPVAGSRFSRPMSQLASQTARTRTGTHQYPDISAQCHAPRSPGIAQYKETHPHARNQVRPHQTGSGFEVGFGRWPGPSA